jgi:hypothetical protein
MNVSKGPNRNASSVRVRIRVFSIMIGRCDLPEIGVIYVTYLAIMCFWHCELMYLVGKVRLSLAHAGSSCACSDICRSRTLDQK